MGKKKSEVRTYPNDHMEDSEHQEAGFKFVFTNFVLNTTAHGFANIILYTNLILKLFWIVAIIGCQVGLWSQIQPLIDTYYNKPTKSLVWLKQQSSVRFPMVTVCNTNMLKRSKWEYLQKTRRFVGIENLTDLEKWYEEEDEDRTFKQDPDDVKEHKHDFKIYQQFADMILENIDVFQYGYSFDELVRKCRWRSIFNCRNETKWRRFWHWKYGSCFSFNTGKDSDGNQSNTLQASQLGLDEGLTLTLGVNQHEYHRMTASAGMVIHVGEQGKSINLNNNVHSLSPGFIYYGALQEHETIRADPFKNNSCKQNEHTDLGNRPNGERIVKKYSTSMCYDICVASTMIELCNCTTYKVPSLNSTRTCTLDDLKCSNNVEKQASNNRISCMNACRLPCHQNEYSVDISAHTFTNDESHDLVKLHLYFKTFETFVIEEKEFYKLENLLGDIGGQLGLWSGISVLTCIEFAFFTGYSLILCVMIAKKRLHEQP